MIRIKYTVLSMMGVFCLSYFIFHTMYDIPTVYGQTPCGVSTPARAANGLVTTQNLSGKFGTTANSTCIVDSKTGYSPNDIPTYDELKSIYYTQTKNNTSIIVSLPPTIADQNVYLVTGDLTIGANPGGSGTAVVFVDGNLTFTANYTYGAATSGTVFIVKGNVNIAQAVTQINAVIISEGFIYTAGAGCNHNSPLLSSPLVINGSLISIDASQEIEFCRTLANNTAGAAEIINHQPKYLVLLRNLVSVTEQRWSEVTGNIVSITPYPTSIPIPTIPTNFTATPASTSQINLSWSASTVPGGGTITGYEILWCTGAGCNPSTLISLGTVLSHPHTGLSPNTVYGYKIRAKDGASPSNFSEYTSPTIYATTQAPSCPTSGLASYWKMNEGSGTSTADNVGTNPGTLTNGPTWVSGKLGSNAINFDGAAVTGDLVNAGSGASLDNVTPLTFTAWVNPRSQGASTTGRIATKLSSSDSNGWLLTVAVTQALQFSMNFDGVAPAIVKRTVNNAIPFNSWSHVVVTWDGTTLSSGTHIYINGVEATYAYQTNGSGSKVSDAANNLIIGNNVNANRSWDGYIDEAGIWNRVLSASEVTTLYNSGTGLTCP